MSATKNLLVQTFPNDTVLTVSEVQNGWVSFSIMLESTKFLEINDVFIVQSIDLEKNIVTAKANFEGLKKLHEDGGIIENKVKTKDIKFVLSSSKAKRVIPGILMISAALVYASYTMIPPNLKIVQLLVSCVVGSLVLIFLNNLKITKD